MAGPNYTLMEGDWQALTQIIADLSSRILDEDRSLTEYILHDGSRAFTGEQSMGTNKLTNVVDPTADQDAATMKFVEDSVAGLISGLDAGGIVYVNSGGDLTTDAGLTWDTTTKLFTANGTIYSSGTTGATPTSGAGTRFMWIPSKRAFRAGAVIGTKWNTTNIGNYSIASGFDVQASGDYSSCFGSDGTASGLVSTVFGTLGTASGDSSTHFGVSGTASGTYSIHFGDSGTASGTSSVHFGSGGTVSGEYSVHCGIGNLADCYALMTLGRFSATTGGTLDSWVATDPILVVGNGTTPSARSTVFTLFKNGNLTTTGLGTFGSGLIQGDGTNLTLKNTIVENTEGGCESTVFFEDHAGNYLASIEGSHQGTGDNARGKLILKTAYDSGLVQQIVIGAYGHIAIGLPSEGDARLWMANVMGGNPCLLDIDTYSDDIWTSEIRLKKSHTDTIGGLVATVTTEELGKIQWFGVDSGGNFDSGAELIVTQVGAVGTEVPCKMDFYTSSSTATSLALSISEAQNFDFQDGNLTTLGTITAASFIIGANTISDFGDLKAIEELAGTSGFAKKTAANTWTLDTNTYLTAEADTLATVVARGANANATINVGASNTLTLASGSITDSGGLISFNNENLLTTGRYRSTSNSLVGALTYPAMIEVASDSTYLIGSGYNAGINSTCYFNAANYTSTFAAAGMFFNCASGVAGSNAYYLGLYGGANLSVTNPTGYGLNLQGLQFSVSNNVDIDAGTPKTAPLFEYKGLFVTSQMGYSGKTISNKADCQNYAVYGRAILDGTYNSTVVGLNCGAYLSTVNNLAGGTGTYTSYVIYGSGCAETTQVTNSYNIYMASDLATVINGKVYIGGLTKPATWDLEVEGACQADDYYSGDGSQGLSTTFLDNDGNTITIKDGLVTAKTAP